MEKAPFFGVLDLLTYFNILARKIMRSVPKSVEPEFIIESIFDLDEFFEILYYTYLIRPVFILVF